MAISAVNIVQTSVLLIVIIIFLRFKRSGKKVLSMQSMLHEANPPCPLDIRRISSGRLIGPASRCNLYSGVRKVGKGMQLYLKNLIVV